MRVAVEPAASPKGEHWESLDWEGWVGGWAAGDESGSDGVNIGETERGVVWAGPWVLLVDGGRDPSLVASLSGEDGASNAKKKKKLAQAAYKSAII